jgi:hypothetical protein
VVVGRRWSLWDEHNGLRTNQGEEEVSGGGIQYAAWLEPASVLGALRFDPPTEATDSGRSAFRTTARVPDFASLGEDEEERLNWDLHGLGGLTDEYLLDVDQERGILLRAECRFRGEPFLIGEALDLAFDEEPGPEVFALEGWQ